MNPPVYFLGPRSYIGFWPAQVSHILLSLWINYTRGARVTFSLPWLYSDTIDPADHPVIPYTVQGNLRISYENLELKSQFKLQIL